ncbi:MAG: 30S ribosomal protein S20 [Desulfatiglans sp.]|nr:30S ribosomal protein S20 [Desulfatiglans sp.]
MANHKSALKRAKQSENSRLRNMGYKTRSKNIVKEVREAVAEKDKEKAVTTLRKATAIIQKSASKGVFHKKKASRKISRLARQINQISAS